MERRREDKKEDFRGPAMPCAPSLHSSKYKVKHKNVCLRYSSIHSIAASETYGMSKTCKLGPLVLNNTVETIIVYR